jgi:hypothetical protein
MVGPSSVSDPSAHGTSQYQAHPAIGLRPIRQADRSERRPFTPPPDWHALPDEVATSAESEFFRITLRFLEGLGKDAEFHAELPISSELSRLRSQPGGDRLIVERGGRVRGSLASTVIDELLTCNPVVLRVVIDGQERLRLNDGWEDVIVDLTEREALLLIELLQ